MGTKSTDSVVVIGIDSASSVACVRSLGRRGIRTIVASELGTVPAFRSRYCDERVSVPSPADDLIGYKDALVSLARRRDVRAIVPLREADVFVLSTFAHEFEGHVATLWPTSEAVRTVHDRIRLVDVAENEGISVPETRLPDDVTNWDRRRIAKGRYAVLTDDYVDTLPSGTAAPVGSARYLEPGVEPDFDALRSEFGHVPIVQEYIPGTEHSFWALYDGGEAVATCGMHQHRAWQYPGGTSCHRETVRDGALEEAGRTLLDALDWHGFASVQFMRDERTGEFTLMEVNPRVWASIPCAVRAGADFPYYFWRLAVDGVHLDDGYDVGIATHRLRGEAVYLYSVLVEDYPFVEKPAFHEALWAVVRSIVEQPRFDYLTLEDPLPFVQDILHSADMVAPNRISYVGKRRRGRKTSTTERRDGRGTVRVAEGQRR